MRLDPQVDDFLAQLAARGAPRVHELTPEQVPLQRIPPPAGSPPAHRPHVREVEDLDLDGLRVRRYRAAQETTGAAAWLHGGGWVVGSVEKADAACRHLAGETGLEVFSIDYRQAPEHRFPAAVDDALAGLGYVAQRAAGRPLVVGGDSAGGNLAAVAARRARDAGGPAIALQLLVYPITAPDTDTGSYREHGDAGLPLGRADMEWFWAQYVPDPAQRRHPDAAPLLAPDLSGLPPAIVLVAGHDVLLDEGVAYAQRLEQAGVPVDLLRADDLPHGFFSLVDVYDRSREIHAELGTLVRRRLAA